MNTVTSIPVAASRDDQGRLPLHWAAASGSAALAQVFLDAAHTAMAKDDSPKDGEAEQADPLNGIPVTEARVIHTYPSLFSPSHYLHVGASR